MLIKSAAGLQSLLAVIRFMSSFRLFRQASVPRPQHLTGALIGLWLACVLVGWVSLTRFATRPGGDDDAPARWPSASALALNKDGPTIVLFAHPKCPCTRASVAELARILEACPPCVATTVVFIRPATVDENWPQTPLWKAAAAIPRVQCVADVDGREAHRFRAVTAGRTLLYAANGDLLFAGGITESRGHRGDNPGETAIVALLRGQRAQTQSTPVFGCPLFKLAACPQ